MQTTDILENQPWTLIEDQLTDDLEINDDIDEPGDDPKPPKPAEKPKGGDNPFKFLAEDLGLELPDDWDGDADEFKQALLEEAKASLISNLDDPLVSGFIDYVTNGGAPAEFIKAMQTPTIDKMTPEEIYVTGMRMTTNFSDAKINKLMERSKDLDDFDDEVAEFRTEIMAAQDEHIKSVLAQQEEQKKARAIAHKQAQEYRKKLVKSKDIMGIPITRNSEFEKFYLQPSERVTHEGKEYLVTAYQKRLLERQKDPVLYETLMAYLEFTNFNNSSTVEKQKVTDSDLKNKLTNYYGSSRTGPTTRLIDES